MSNGRAFDQRSIYRMRVKGSLDNKWADWFDGFTITPQTSDETLLTGPVADQAALHGLLDKIRDLGLPLLSVNRIEPGLQEGTGQPIWDRCSKTREERE
jgi:hypothetical protein